jgi:hypothetical protein
MEYLEEAQYRSFRNPYPIAWNIKLYGWSFESGKGGDLPVLDRYDEEWEQYLQDTPDFFWWACEDCLRWIIEDNGVTECHPDKSIAEIPYKMGVTGRSGGWLVLAEYYGYKLWKRSDVPYFEDWDYQDLWVLYKFCKEVERIVAQRHEAMAYEYNFRRYDKEQEEWIPRDYEAETAEEESSGISFPVI